jgi:hypothetical protein
MTPARFEFIGCAIDARCCASNVSNASIVVFAYRLLENRRAVCRVVLRDDGTRSTSTYAYDCDVEAIHVVCASDGGDREAVVLVGDAEGYAYANDVKLRRFDTSPIVSVSEKLVATRNGFVCETRYDGGGGGDSGASMTVSRRFATPRLAPLVAANVIELNQPHLIAVGGAAVAKLTIPRVLGGDRECYGWDEL